MSNIKQTELVKSARPELKFFIVFVLLMVVFAVLITGKPAPRVYSVFDRTWGFDNLTFLGLVAKIILLCLAALFIIPATNKYIVSGFTRLAEKIAGLRRFRVVLFGLVSILSVFVFYLLKIRYVFLGDLDLRMDQVMRKDFLTNEYLTMRALYCFSMLGAKFGQVPITMFKLYSFLCGGAFIFITCLLADLLGKTPVQKLFFFLLHVFTGLIIVFCGYIEVYATPVMCLTLYVYLGLRYLKYNMPFWPVVLSLALAIGTHLLCFAAVPSLVILWYFGNKASFKFVTGLSNSKIAMFITLLILAALLMLLKKGNSFVLTVKAPRELPNYMTFFSFRHFWELFNGQLLACGLSFIFVFIMLVYAIRKSIRLNASAYFLISLSGCLLFIVLIANLHRGSGDWDIMAITAVSVNLLTGLLIAIIYNNNTTVQNYLLSCLIFFNALNAGAWTYINHTDRSIQKIERMLVTDPGTYYTSRITGSIELIIVYKLNKLFSEMERAGLNACNNAPANDIRACVIYGKNLVAANKPEEARALFESLLARSPYVPESYVYLMDYYNKKKDERRMMQYISDMFDAFVQQSDIFLNNSNVQSVAYLQLFDILQQYELKNNNVQRAQKIIPVVQKLRGMNLKSR